MMITVVLALALIEGGVLKQGSVISISVGISRNSEHCRHKAWIKRENERLLSILPSLFSHTL